MVGKPFAPATDRNRQPILDVIRVEFAACHTVLEIGSGTGQHAVAFGSDLIDITWQTSDRNENHDAINTWIDDASLANVLPPLPLDVLVDAWPESIYDGVFSANTAHIMSFLAVEKMLAIAGSALNIGGIFCLYGPFLINGEFNSKSNAEFDQSLRSRDSQMGIRDLSDLDRIGSNNGLHRIRLYSMPANNYLIVWTKRMDKKKL
jgi:hypothetical protein